MDNNDSRIEAIEVKLAYLEDFITRLQDETVRRNSEIDRLKAEHGAMKSRLSQISRDLEEYPDRKPPHY